MFRAIGAQQSNDGRDVGGAFQANAAEFLSSRVISAIPLSAVNRMQPNGGVNNFTLQQYKSNGHHAVGLDLHQPGSSAAVVRAYWVKQGGFCDIPVRPHEGEGTVFTPDFSGCSLYVDQIDAKTYRVYHVEGGKLQEQYTSKPHFLGQAARWTEQDYVRAGNPRGFALLRFHDGSWWIQYQKQVGVRGIGLKDGRLTISEAQAVDGSGEILVNRISG